MLMSVNWLKDFIKISVEAPKLAERLTLAGNEVDRVIERLRPQTGHIPGATLFMQAVQDLRIGGRLSNAQYQYTLQSSDLAELNAFAPRMLAKFRELPALRDVATDQQNRGLQAVLVIDRDAASRLGIQAQTIDPRLRAHEWIADRLLELAAGDSPPPAPGGYLDAEAVWPLLLQRMIGLEGERPDLSLLLKWSSAAENVLRFRRLPEEPRRAVEDWLAGGIGPAATSVLRCAGATDQPDALPVGLVLGVVHHPQASYYLVRE